MFVIVTYDIAMNRVSKVKELENRHKVRFFYSDI